MLKILARFLGLVKGSERESKRNNQLALTNISVTSSIQLRNTTFRIVHPGGKDEVYQHPILASYFMENYPGMEVTRSDFFKCPFGAVLSAENYLIPGNKYLLVPSKTRKKLERRYLQKNQMKQLEGRHQPILVIEDVADAGSGISEETVCSANGFLICNEKWSDSQRKRPQKKKPFVPPIQKPRIRKEDEWEPGLPSIQEVSP